MAVAFARQAAAAPPAQLCGTCVELLQVSAAGLTLMTGRNSGPVCASDPRTSELDDLQFALGEGPSRDAFITGVPVTEPDLLVAPSDRWPHFTLPALESGTNGVFAFPLNVGAARIGVFTIYQDAAGSLTDEQTADSLVVAEVLAQTMLSVQARSAPGVLAADLHRDGAHRAQVHQASGMVAVQLGVDVTEALVRLRAHAFASDRPIAEVADDVVGRRLRLGDDRVDGDRADDESADDGEK